MEIKKLILIKGKFYKIIDVGKDDYRFKFREDIIGKIIKFIKQDKGIKHRDPYEDYVACVVRFQPSSSYIFKRRGKSVSFYQVKLEEIQSII